MVLTTVDFPFKDGNISTQTYNNDKAQLENGKFLIVGKQDNPDWLWAQVWNVSPTGQSTGTIKLFEGEFDNINYPLAARISSTQAVIMYEDNNTDTIYGRVLTVDASDNIVEGPRQVITETPSNLYRGSNDYSLLVYPVEPNRFWIFDDRNFSNVDVYEYTVSGNTISSTPPVTYTNLDNTRDNDFKWLLVREIPGTTNFAIKMGRDLVLVDNSLTELSRFRPENDYRWNFSIENSSSYYFFFRDHSVATWDGTSSSFTDARVNYTSGGSTNYVWDVRQVDTNTWIVWHNEHNNGRLYTEVVRRLDPITWERSPNGLQNEGSFSGWNSGGWPFEIIKWDNNTFYLVYQTDNNNYWRAYFMTQT